MKKGFTLAETLITLGIIGVIAAITLPGLIQNYENAANSALLKEDVSILSQMMLMANEQGAMAKITEANNEQQMKNWFETYFAPYLKTVDVCYHRVGCWSEFVYYSNGKRYVDSNGCGYRFVSFILNNGSYVCMDDFNDFRYGVSTPIQTIGMLVDVNGPKQPNTFGKDIFGLLFKDNKLIPGGYDMTQSEIDANCSKSCTAAKPYCGIACLTKAQQKGYTLPVLKE